MPPSGSPPKPSPTIPGSRPACCPAVPPAERSAVTLTAAAPRGSMQAQVTVTLANGQRLRVPVTAYVTTSHLP